MPPETLTITRLHPDARIPARQTEGASGYDLHARLDGDVVIEPVAYGSIAAAVQVLIFYSERSTTTGADVLRDAKALRPTLIGTGIAVQIPPGYEGQIRARSSMAKRGVILATGVSTGRRRPTRISGSIRAHSTASGSGGRNHPPR